MDGWMGGEREIEGIGEEARLAEGLEGIGDVVLVGDRWWMVSLFSFSLLQLGSTMAASLARI